MAKANVPKGPVLDPEAWATENAQRLRYFGCRICDLGPEAVKAIDVLWAKGFRRASIERYVADAGMKLPQMNDTAFRKHFDGDPREHGRA